jgi:hypothetical protein
MILAAMGRSDLIAVLLKEMPCPAVDQINNNGTTALVFACSMGHFASVQVLCEHGANVNWAIGSLDTPVMVAAEEGFDAIVSYLCIIRAAAMESKNEAGRTALLCACDQGHLSTVIILLDCGANLEAADNFQATPLVIACTNGFVDIARLLLQRGANTTCISEAILTIKCLPEEEEATASSTSTDKIAAIKTALTALLSTYSWIPALDLQRGCQQNNLTQVKRLLSAYPQLAAAVYHRDLTESGGTSATASATASVSASVTRLVYGGGATPLMVACLHNALHVVKVLVTEYPDEYNLASRDGRLIDGSRLVEVGTTATTTTN